MKNVFYINRARLNDSHPHAFDWEGLCFGLLMGDYKNDKLPRHIDAVVVSDDQDALLADMKSRAANTNADVLYLVAFSHDAAPVVAATKNQNSGKLFIVNQPSRKHPAALVALADGVKRIKAHHLRMAASGPATTLLGKIMPPKQPAWREDGVAKHITFAQNCVKTV